MDKDQERKSFEAEAPEQAPADPIAALVAVGSEIATLLKRIEGALTARGGPLAGVEPMEPPVLYTVWVRPSGHVMCDDQYGHTLWELTGRYEVVRDAVLAAAKDSPDIAWYSSDNIGRRHAADRAYFAAGNFSE